MFYHPISFAKIESAKSLDYSGWNSASTTWWALSVFIMKHNEIDPP